MNMQIEVELRPCLAYGRKALFHKWDTIATYSVNGTFKETTAALVEFEDGTIDICKINELKFVDGKIRDYAFPSDMD